MSNVKIFIVLSLALFLLVSLGYGQEEQIIESLEFREVDIKDILRQLAKQFNLNIICSKSVGGLVTVQLNNVTVEEAIDSLLL
jgi:type IV pilus assembly protein PilQ